MADAQNPANWRIILAFILDLITAFFVFGFIIGWLTGGLTSNGFQLDGAPALLLFVVILVFFWLNRRLRWRPWFRLLKAG
jgi:magnesium-transporting ATPase (P-type)